MNRIVHSVLTFDCRVEDAPHRLTPLYQVWDEEKARQNGNDAKRKN